MHTSGNDGLHLYRNPRWAGRNSSIASKREHVGQESERAKWRTGTDDLQNREDNATIRTHPCLLCQTTFETKKAWFLHAHHRHDYRTMHGEATTGTKCLVCAKEYFHSSKLHNHLRYSRTCRNTMWQHAQGRPVRHSQAVHPQRPWQRELDPQEPDLRAQDRDSTILQDRSPPRRILC